MEEQIKPIYTIEELKDRINIFLNKEFANIKLIEFISQEFAKKGLNFLTPKLLFENKKDVDSLIESELLAFTIAVNKFFSNSQEPRKDEKYIKEMNPKLYFYVRTISENELLQPKKNKEIKEIIFEDVQKLNDNEFQTFLSAKKLFELYSSSNIIYLKSVQRATRKIKLKDGSIRELENYNKEGLRSLEDRFIKQDILTTQITFTIIIWDGKTPNIDFIPYYKEHENFGRIVFIPNYNVDDKSYSFINVSDGAHRLSAICSAYERHPEIAEEKLSVAIKIVTLNTAKQFISDVFKINMTDKTYLQTMSNTPINNYINIIIDNSVFKNKTVKTKADEKINSYYANYEWIKKTIKYLNINLPHNDLMLKMEAKNVANKINTLIDLFRDRYNCKTNDELKDKTILLDKKMCIAYIIAGEKLKNETDEDILKMYEYIIKKTDDIKYILKEKEINIIIEKFNKMLRGCK